ncbi:MULTISPECIES: hypothetical protein [Acinetobacter]|uniref:hypothetical protein n=1 Tax=Acinetobacter TaxID=469 RepID=UPI001F069222|nr:MULTISPECIES: hypothetical protein [Acinetobacter]MCH2003660.1 hypothetical protein [Acinetobacter seifertii]WQF74941.1 hypothetical protein OKW95_19590 [Acinetobacter oleivorans]
MSKVIFASILKRSFLEVTKADIDAFWLHALNATLPARVLDVISPSLIHLPLVHDAYVNKLGHSPIIVRADQARRLILELLIDGPRYMSEIQKLFSIPSELRTSVMEQLIADKYVVFEFCPIGNCICFDLNPKLRINSELKYQIDRAMQKATQMTLYQISLRAIAFDYAILCIWAKLILRNGSLNYTLNYEDANVLITHKRVTP